MNNSELDRINALIPSFVDKKYHVNYPRDNVHFWIVREDGTTLGDIFPHVCHQGLHRLDLDKELFVKQQPIAIINSLQKLLVPDDIALRFYEWLLNLSPYRNCFVTKDSKKLLDDHVIVADCDAPANLLADAMIATRSCTENYAPGIHNTMETWDRLVQLGVHPDAAFIASNRLVNVDGQLSIRPYGYQHAAINDPDRSWDRFVNHSPNNAGDEYRKVKTYQWAGNFPQEIWFGSRFPIMETMHKAAMHTVHTPKKTNPFDVMTDVNLFPFEQAMEEIAFSIKNLNGELNAKAA